MKLEDDFDITLSNGYIAALLLQVSLQNFENKSKLNLTVETSLAKWRIKSVEMSANWK